MAKAKAPRANLVDKEPTELHTGFVEYIKSETGYDADEKSVQLATLLRMDYQRSDGNQKRLAANKKAKEAAEAEREKARQARADKKASKDSGSTKAAPAAKKTAAKKAPAKKAAAPARRRAAKKSASSESF